MSHILFGVLGSIIGALAALALAWWTTVVSRESGPDARLGEAFLMFLAPMAGLVFGFMGGVVYSKLAHAGQGLQFLQALGRVTAGILVLCVVSEAWMWWNLDREPRVDGKLLEMEFELRMPVGYVPPSLRDGSGEKPYIQISGPDNWREYHLRNQHAKLVDGRMVLRGIVPLQTDPASKNIMFFLGSEAAWPGRHSDSRYQGYFGFPAFRPAKEDFEWTAWLRSSWDPDKPKPSLAECFNLRYRFRFREAGREIQEVYSIP